MKVGGFGEKKKWSLFRKILGKRKRFENVQRNKK
jgi:hypothetical protein